MCMARLGDIKLPDISGDSFSTEQKINQILEYMMRLKKQLNFVLSNLDAENMTGDMAESIDEIKAVGKKVESKISDEQFSTFVLQNAREIALLVTAEDFESRMTQTADKIETMLTYQDFESYVTQTAHEISTLVTTAEFESFMSQTAHDITLGVKKDELIAAINVSPETISIMGDRINLQGTVTANNNFKILPDGSMEALNGRFSGRIDAAQIGDYVLNYQGLIKHRMDGSWQFWFGQGEDGRHYLGSDSSLTILANPESPLEFTANNVWFNLTNNAHRIGMATVAGYNEACLLPGNNRTCNIGVDSRMFDYAAIRYIYCPEGVHSGSSRTIKHDIQPLGDQGAVVDALEPVTYRLNDDPQNKQQLGLVYEDTVQVAPLMCSQRVEGDLTTAGLDYSRLAVILLAEMKSMKKEMGSLRGRVEELENGRTGP